MTPADRDLRARFVRNSHARRDDPLRAWRIEQHRRRPLRSRLLTAAFLGVVVGLIATVCTQAARLAGWAP